MSRKWYRQKTEPIKSVWLSQPPLWASGAQSCRRTLGNSLEHALGLSFMRLQEAGDGCRPSHKSCPLTTIRGEEASSLPFWFCPIPDPSSLLLVSDKAHRQRHASISSWSLAWLYWNISQRVHAGCLTMFTLLSKVLILNHPVYTIFFLFLYHLQILKVMLQFCLFILIGNLW